MAFCLLKPQRFANRAGQYLVSFRVSNNSSLNSIQEYMNLNWLSISRTSSTSINYYNNESRRLHQNISGRASGWTQLRSSNEHNAKISPNMVRLSEVYSQDPLAILLHSRLQVYNEPCLPVCNNCRPVVQCSVSPSSGVNSTALLTSGAAVLRCSPTSSQEKDHVSNNPNGPPSQETLQKVHDALVKSLTTFFSNGLDYSIYDKDITFENRFRGTSTKGISSYALQMSALNIIGHLKHAFVKVDVLKTSQSQEEGTIKVRWRIKGVKSRKAVAGFFQAKKWSASEVQGDDSSNWYDGFSVFCVNKEGLIYHHVADYRMPDEEKLHRRDNDNFAAKMALLLGLVPRPAAGHGNAMGDIPPLY